MIIRVNGEKSILSAVFDVTSIFHNSEDSTVFMLRDGNFVEFGDVEYETISSVALVIQSLSGDNTFYQWKDDSFYLYEGVLHVNDALVSEDNFYVCKDDSFYFADGDLYINDALVSEGLDKLLVTEYTE